LAPSEDGLGFYLTREEGLDPNAALELPFELTVKRRAEDVVLTLRGELDLAAKEHYEQELEKLEDDGLERLIIDLRALTFMDSTGINLLLRTLRDSEENGFTVTVVQGSGQVPALLEATGVAEQLPLVDESALG
jgi:anti-anti-sigma factor